MTEKNWLESDEGREWLQQVSAVAIEAADQTEQHDIIGMHGAKTIVEFELGKFYR